MARHKKILKTLAAKLGKTVSEVKSLFMHNVMTALKLYLGKQKYSSPFAWVHAIKGHLSVFLNTAYDLAEKTGKIPTPQEILEAVRSKVTA